MPVASFLVLLCCSFLFSFSFCLFVSRCLLVASIREVPELAVKMQACFERGDAGGAGQAQKRLNAWARKREVGGEVRKHFTHLTDHYVGPLDPHLIFVFMINCATAASYRSRADHDLLQIL